MLVYLARETIEQTVIDALPNPPRENIVAPAVRLPVIDEEGNPAFGMFVKQEWEYMTVGSEGHVAYSATDINGYVQFPQRAERISPLRKGLGTLRELKNVMHGYGYGPRAIVWVHGQDAHYWSYVSCEVGRSIPQELTLKRQAIAMYR